jgi:hypothetical protein
MFGNQHSKWHLSWKGINKLDAQDGLPNNAPAKVSNILSIDDGPGMFLL